MRSAALFSVLMVCALVGQGSTGDEASFDWQQDYADVTETGDIVWKPQPSRFTPGQTLRYIDYERGSDANDGISRQQPWKHHPWDANARDKAAAFEGVDTYVFKGGVVYRGQLTVPQDGQPGRPIRLTRDPD